MPIGASSNAARRIASLRAAARDFASSSRKTATFERRMLGSYGLKT